MFCDTRKRLFRCCANTLWCSARVYIRAALLLDIYINDLPQPIPILSHNNTKQWKLYQFIFGMIKQKLFFSRFKSPPRLILSNGNYSLKQPNTVEYLPCDLDSNLNRESRACRVPKNINRKLSFLWSQSNYLNYLCRRLLCNALIQVHFEYGCAISPLWLWMYIMVSSLVLDLKN